MPKFFASDDCILCDTVCIKGDDAHHISHSLRMKTGEKISVSDSHGVFYDCEITEINKESVTAKILSKSMCDTEPPYFAVIYQGIPKLDKMDIIVQKAVECGAFKIVPVSEKRCIAKIDSPSAMKKVERWQKISEAAAKQSGRGTVPHIAMPQKFEDALLDAADADIKIFCYENENGVDIKDILCKYKNFEAKPKVAIFIGPEGGFDENEVEKAAKCGFSICTLGKRILRTETASGFVLSCLSYELEL
ncbi:MAG: 16S rRNA (uracil(1498)-N(3))-methyltransferase [Clostridia bacterium]|nr:16S rRNA (uracil(1498)-N(3))-methyltransferase [Clostridia bacterium]